MTGHEAISCWLTSGQDSCQVDLMNTRFEFLDLGLIEYNKAYKQQLHFLKLVQSGKRGDVVLFTEHFPVITIGRCGKESDILPALIRRQHEDPTNVGLHSKGRKPTIAVVKTDRGGGTTFHNPGQLVIYPIIALRPREQRIRWLLRCYEEIIIQLLAYFGVKGYRQLGKPGVWTEQGKIASIGVTLQHWVTYHGIALNINNDLYGFDLIVPCGIPNCSITSMKQMLKQELSISDVKTVLKNIFPPVWKEFTHYQEKLKEG